MSDQVSHEAVEELLELLWTAAEDGLAPLHRHRLPSTLRCFQPHPISGRTADPQEAIGAALARGWIKTDDDGSLWLSEAGQVIARLIVRRHRLTENLLAGVLDVSDDAVESTACQMEHILNPEVTEAVCAFLGHPPICPHGRRIPHGPCCAAADAHVEPLIIPLEHLRIGETARVSLIHSQRARYLQQLSQMGLIPGSPITVRRRRPALIVEVGQTELALDAQAEREIFVRRRSGRGPSGHGAPRV